LTLFHEFRHDIGIPLLFKTALWTDDEARVFIRLRPNTLQLAAGMTRGASACTVRGRGEPRRSWQSEGGFGYGVIPL